MLTQRSPVWFWAVFAVIQTAGYGLLPFTNSHNNLAPLASAILLLLPGSLAALTGGFSDHTPPVVQCAVISGINLLLWFFLWRVTFPADKSRP